MSAVHCLIVLFTINALFRSKDIRLEQWQQLRGFEFPFQEHFAEAAVSSGGFRLALGENMSRSTLSPLAPNSLSLSPSNADLPNAALTTNTFYLAIKTFDLLHTVGKVSFC